MLLPVSIIVVAALLALIVWWLQRQETRDRRDSVDRSGELPPLQSTGLPDFIQPPTAAPPPAANLQPSPVNSRPVQTTEPVPVSTAWQDEVKRLKDTGDLELGLALCQQHFPKAQAFQQSAILLRLQLKQALERQQDPTPLLTRLYRSAVLADLFRGGAPLKPANARQTLKNLAIHEFRYQDIGHRQLKLLTKGDAKLLEQHWGQPSQHQHAEIALGTAWENLCR
ncbi:MAG TPA: hypothetical protein VMH83_00635 [Candidatus Acidoferrum sp.]|nr:hypothetical protein [Candidatus Acidoferrum sp.]